MSVKQKYFKCTFSYTDKLAAVCRCCVSMCHKVELTNVCAVMN